MQEMYLTPHVSQIFVFLFSFLFILVSGTRPLAPVPLPNKRPPELNSQLFRNRAPARESDMKWNWYFALADIHC